MRDINFFDPDGPNGWLASFSCHDIHLSGRRWSSVEHYFQAMKFLDTKIQKKIAGAKTPAEAKRIAKFYAERKRQDWPKVRNLIMYNAIQAKFLQHPNLLSALNKTGRRRIQEITDDDCYWGCGPDRRGQNQMGRLLMRLRDNLRRRRR
jgi:ribA/ribD-fused uncharacterized protein